MKSIFLNACILLNAYHDFFQQGFGANSMLHTTGVVMLFPCSQLYY